jgi:hypothetical protein
MYLKRDKYFGDFNAKSQFQPFFVQYTVSKRVYLLILCSCNEKQAVNVLMQKKENRWFEECSYNNIDNKP